jgi:3-dehydroquinate synthase
MTDAGVSYQPKRQRFLCFRCISGNDPPHPYPVFWIKTIFDENSNKWSMPVIKLNAPGGKTEIRIGEKMESFRRYVSAGSVVITDECVSRLYGDRWTDFPVIVCGTGEKIKTPATAHEIYGRLLALGVDRSSFVVGIGGGIVCDIAGYVASTWLRGIRFGFVPTTLLAQCDAAIGGKNGVNFDGYKNMIGTISQPAFVICDPGVLNTLPEAELANGFAEIVKHALIGDARMLDFIHKNISGMQALDPAVMTHLTERSVQIKTAIVSRDERETGERRKLNFGHTFGHAIEKVSGMSHGRAVSIGMVLAAKLSLQKGYLQQTHLDGIVHLLTALGLPVDVPPQRTEIIQALVKDKKRQTDHIHFVLLKNPGDAVVEKISLTGLKVFFDEVVR